MAGAGRILVWWDREVDQAGRPIRRDVRLAGHEIWEQACQRTQALLDDHGPAAELMENAVAQVSRYLDRIGAPESSAKHGLVMVAFCRGLQRYAAKLHRLEFVGGSGELASRVWDEAWVSQMNARLELTRIIRKTPARKWNCFDAQGCRIRVGRCRSDIGQVGGSHSYHFLAGDKENPARTSSCRR